MRRILPVLFLVLIAAGGLITWIKGREVEPDLAVSYPQGAIRWVVRPQSAVFSQPGPHGRPTGVFNFEAAVINRGPVRAENVRVYLKSGVFGWMRLQAMERPKARTRFDPGQGEEFTVTVFPDGKSEEQIRAEIGKVLSLRVIWNEGGGFSERIFDVPYPTGQSIELTGS